MVKANEAFFLVDKRGNPGPLLRPVKGSTYDISYSDTKGTSAVLTENAVRLFATTDCYIKIGEIADQSVSSSDYDLFVPALMPIDIKLFDTDKYIAALRVTTSGVLYISGWR